MVEIKFVKQKEISGCAVACIAMVLGKTYDEIAADFQNNFSENGIELEKTVSYLADFGFEIIQKEVVAYNNVKFGKDELLKPFAPVHIVRIKLKFDSTYGHLVVMDGSGKLYCPDESTEEKIKNSFVITTVLGLFPQ
jgi:ABC-type bacteriocin/lantibiotic exporter with double-glycine peptidase domain